MRPTAFAIALAAAAAAAAVRAQPVVSSGAQPGTSAAAQGRLIYMRDGCYECHGIQGQGAGATGPKIAPRPLPLTAFVRQLRAPRDVMPVYTQAVLPDADVQDIYAYLEGIAPAKAVAEIPLLNR
jgi:ubiquinol-cytochrome c reductase cytochrome c subunit